MIMWSVDLEEYHIECQLGTTIKGQVLADFMPKLNQLGQNDE